jgi:hypothetical protein
MRFQMSDEKDAKNKSLIVRDNRFGILESGLANLSPEKKQTILAKAAEEALNLEIESRRKQHQSGLALDEMGEVFSRFEEVPHSKGLNFTEVSGEFKTGSGKVNIKARKGFGCFVATVAFDSPEAVEVCCLRGFRDNVLCNYIYGRKFIDWYYRNGPRLAIIVGRYQWLKWSIRKMLSCLVKIIRLRSAL